VLNAYISGIGGYVPPWVVTNDDLAKNYGIDTTHEWIHQRTGIEERRYAEEGVGSADMGYEAAKLALAHAKLTIRDIDMIIFATLSPEHHFPGSSVFMQRRNSRSSSRASSRRTAALRALPRHPQPVLGLSLRPRRSAPRWCRRAREARAPRGLRDALGGARLHDARPHGDLALRRRRGRRGHQRDRRPEARHAHLAARRGRPRRRGALHAGLGHPKRPFINLPDGKDGDGVHPRRDPLAADGRQAGLPQRGREDVHVAHGRLLREGLSSDDIDLFVFHQANMRINQYVANTLGIPETKLIHNIHKYGNTTAATIPLLLWEAVETGRLKPGMKVAMAPSAPASPGAPRSLDW
jgi:3-oxoacyl-[acyl-carrier-protein] synthase-3